MLTLAGMLFQLNEKTRLELSARRFAPSLLSAILSNRGHLSVFLPWVDRMKNMDACDQYLQICEQLYVRKEEISFMIIHNETLAGRIGLHHLSQHNRSCSIGYWLTSEAEGKGIITQACRTLINYAYGQLHLNRIEIRAAINNVRSRAVPERLHFTYEGIAREAEVVNNQFLDLAIYSMLKKDWQE